MPTAAAPMARFCGEIILPSTPPELLAAAMSVGERSACLAAVTCSAPKSAFDDVSEPVTATPNQPSSDEKNANAPPAPAAHCPMVIVWPDRFMTYAMPSTVATVAIAQRNSTTVCHQMCAAREIGRAHV